MRKCLGEPSEFDLVEGREIWHLSRKLLHHNRIDRVEDVVRPPDYDKDREERINRFRSSPSTEPVVPGFCYLRIEFGPDGRATSIFVKGRDSTELNADSRCTHLTKRCLAY